MPLNWNIENCKDWETLKTDEEWPLTHALIWASMSIGIREITEENLPEYYARIHIWESLRGPYTSRRDPETGKFKGKPVSVEDLRKRIGLWTNASTMSRTKWLKNLNTFLNQELDEYKGYAERDLKKAAVEA
jgi:hypothetical protein